MKFQTFILLSSPAVVYCPSCGSYLIESEDKAMESVNHYHRFYCQGCGCVFRVLTMWEWKVYKAPKKREVKASE